MMFVLIGTLLAAYSYAQLAVRHGKSTFLHILLSAVSFLGGYFAVFTVLPVLHVLLSTPLLSPNTTFIVGLIFGGILSYVVLLKIDKVYSRKASDTDSLDGDILGN